MAGRAFITGKAMVCSLGDSMDRIVDAVRHQRIRREQLPFTLAGLPYTRPYYLILRNEADRPENRSDAYFHEVLYAAVAGCLADAGLESDQIRQTAVFFGSTSMDVPVFEGCHGHRAARRERKPLPADRGSVLDGGGEASWPGRAAPGGEGAGSSVSESFLGASDGYGKIASALSARFGMEGGCYTFTTACTSSANALLYATAMIRQGRIERALVVGYDLFNRLGFYGFEGLKSLAASDYRPFDRERDGLILGEACGVALLEGKRRRADDFQCLDGANLCDTYSVTSHDEEGAAVAETMNRALERAAIAPGDVIAVKAHATGTENNDRTECAAMKTVFGPRIPPVTCLKPFIGHTAGACGVCELVLFTESVKAGFIPATPGFRQADEQLGLKPLRSNGKAGKGIYMLNYFGFGGNCTTLLIANRDDGA